MGDVPGRVVGVRRADVANAQAIAAAHVASWREAYAGIMPEHVLASLSVEECAALLRSILGDPDAEAASATFIAEESPGVALGFASCMRQRDAGLAASGFSGEFAALYVPRHAQRRGVGRALMAATARHLAAHGHGSAALWVLRGNVSARRFYEALGGALVAERDDRDGERPRPDVEVAYGWRDTAGMLAP
jgi:GNAT superfamily N-acetyltransferase